MVVAGLAYSTVEALATAASAGWALLLGMVLLTPAALGTYALASAVARGEAPSINLLLSGFKDGRAYALGALTTVLVFAGLLLFLLPAVVVMVGMTWSLAVLHRRPVGALDAARRSFALAKENLGFTLLFLALTLVLHSLGTGTILLGAFTFPFLVCLKLVLFEQLDRGLE